MLAINWVFGEGWSGEGEWGGFCSVCALGISTLRAHDYALLALLAELGEGVFTHLRRVARRQDWRAPCTDWAFSPLFHGRRRSSRP